MNETHDFWIGRLSEHLDGDLPPKEARAVEEHLADCAGCRRVREELAEVRRRARALPGAEPERDLWPGILDRLGEDPSAEKVIPLRAGYRAPEAPDPRGGRRFVLSLPQVAAAAVVLLAGGWMAGTFATPEPPALPATGGDAAFLQLVDDRTDLPGPLARELLALERTVLDRMGELDPETRATLVRNLDVIDRAIRESLDALTEEPGSEYLQGHLGAAMERKRGYLERMATLLEG